MQMGFYFDQSRCVGCYTCVIACKDWHDVPAGQASWIKVLAIEKGKYPGVSVDFMFLTCFHCVEAPCLPACPAGAITKKAENGVMVVDRNTCLGKDTCEICKEVCPYDSPQFGDEDNAKMQMCNFCMDRLTENKDPICVGACPLRALDAGPLDELKKQYGAVREVEGFVYSPEAKPSIVLKPKAKRTST